jgi:rhodanese-related sulfurtransferase
MGLPIEISATKADQFINENWNDIFLLDVRTPMEFEHESLTGATNIHIQSIPERLNEIPKDKKIVCYCAHGIRSMDSALYLLSKGYKEVYHVKGGLSAMKDARRLKQ